MLFIWGPCSFHPSQPTVKIKNTKETITKYFFRNAILFLFFFFWRHKIWRKKIKSCIINRMATIFTSLPWAWDKPESFSMRVFSLAIMTARFPGKLITFKFLCWWVKLGFVKTCRVEEETIKSGIGWYHRLRMSSLQQETTPKDLTSSTRLFKNKSYK